MISKLTFQTIFLFFHNFSTVLALARQLLATLQITFMLKNTSLVWSKRENILSLQNFLLLSLKLIAKLLMFCIIIECVAYDIL